MAGWGVAPVPAAKERLGSNFIILKCDERTVEELLSKRDQWLKLDELTLDTREADALKEIVEKAIEKSSTDDLYQPLADRMKSGAWRGLVCIGMELSDMPDQLGALEALARPLLVHHVGVDLTAIEQDTAQYRASIFGLIDKNSPGDFLPKHASQKGTKSDAPPMQLQLAELKVLVDNDAVKKFSCKVNARVDVIFQTRLAKGSDSNEVKLDGKYQSRVGPDGQRQDNYSFSIGRVEGADPLFSFSDDAFVLEEVALTRAELVTIIEERKGQRHKNGMLLLDGWLKFGEIGEFKLFAIDKLEFAALGVKFGAIGTGLDFDLKFEFPDIRFDFARFNRLQKRRDGSLLNALPFRLSGFRIGDLSLAKLDYFNFGSLGGGIQELIEFKMALDFDLDLGSLGALGKKLEHFKLNFLLGWDPKKLGELAAGFRIDTGDGGGALDVGIEGMIRLTAEHFHIGKAEDNSGRFILAFDNARLKLFSVELPTRIDQRFSLYLLVDPQSPKFTDKVAWYGAFFAENGTDGPVSIKHLALGQRIDLLSADGAMSGVRTTREVMGRITKFTSFAGPDADRKFLKFAKDDLKYDPQRGWFAALQGRFFEVFELQLLLRDPDMYGIYIGLGKDPETAKELSMDLLYQKLSEGVGLYSGELDLCSLVGQIDLGAVSVTLGAIKFEVYTDGGFLIDLGFPEHVDYSRSFVAQAGIFIGKGGVYIGRTPGQAVPKFKEMKGKLGQAFRMGLALRLGLGREFQKGPLYASLSVSLFARVEGAVAEIKKALTAGEGGVGKALATQETLLAGGSYAFFLRGEVGIILEIEGRVDLRLVQARVLVRAWIAAGITLQTGESIILHAEAGVRVSVRVVIGKIRIFRKTIKIYVTLGYSTRLSYEWELRGGPKMKMLALDEWQWKLPPSNPAIFHNAPARLRLSLEVTRKAAREAVMVPMATLPIAGNAAQNPLAALARGMILWALDATGSDVEFQRFSVGNEGPTITVLSERIRTFSTLPDAWIATYLLQVLGGSTIELAATDADVSSDPKEWDEAWPFPVPPGLVFALAGKDYNLDQVGEISDAELNRIEDEIAAQFALQAASTSAPLSAGVTRPMVEHLFRNWLEALALNTLDAMQSAWTQDAESVDYKSISMSTLMKDVDWGDVAGRTGRYLFGGVRVSTAADRDKTEPLFDRAGLMFSFPDTDFRVELKDNALGWLKQNPGTLTVKGELAASIAQAKPAIAVEGEPEVPSATRLVPRVFSLPDVSEVKEPSNVTALVHFTEDLRRQLSLAQAEKASPLGRLGLKVKESNQDSESTSVSANFASLFDFSVQLPSGQKASALAPKAGGPAVLEVLGTSEAQRKPLDALFPHGVPVSVLGQAKLYLAIRPSESDPYKIIDWSKGLQVVRATTNRERNPGESLSAFVAPTDDSFLASATDLAEFLLLLRRAAIVNAGGTYLLFKELPGDLLDYLKTKGARLSVLLVFDPSDNAQLPGNAVNAAVPTTKPADGKQLVAMVAGPDQGVNDRFFESAAVREPGAELFRFWRKAPRNVDPSNEPVLDKPDDNDKQEYLDRQFDMLEFGVAGYGKPMKAHHSLPLASETVSKRAEESDKSPYTEAQVADLNIPSDLDEWLKYDLLVPLWRWAPAGKHQQPGDRPNPYNALRQDEYTIEYGWRDIFGNCLTAEGEARASFTHKPKYSDPLGAPESWPAVAVRFRFGEKAGTLELCLFDTSAKAGLEAANRERALWRAIHQLEAPQVKVSVSSQFGALTPPPNLDSPEDFALALATVLRGFLKSASSPKPWIFKVTPQTRKPHAVIDLALAIEREPSYCRDGSPHDVYRVESPVALIAREPVEGEGTSLARRLAKEFEQAFPKHMLARGTADDGSSQWWAVDRRILSPTVESMAEVHAQPPLALATVSARDVKLTVFEKEKGSWTAQARTVDMPDIDSDALFGDFLDKLERFVGPAMAGHTALQSDCFNRVMRAKHSMLGPREAAGGLFRGVRNVISPTDTIGPLADPARRLLRQACGNDFRAFYNTAAVLVRSLGFPSDVPEEWLGDGEETHKLHGRFIAREADKNLRLSTFGIPLSRTTAIAVAFDLPPGMEELQLHDRLEFEITHIEREVDAQTGGADAMPAASSWLQLIEPEDAKNGMPLVVVSDGRQSIPIPIRELPALPSLSDPLPEKARPPGTFADYTARMAYICGWRYQFKLNGLMGSAGRDRDEACCRLVYNVDPGASVIATQTAAQPLFAGLGDALARYKGEGDGLWAVLNEPTDPLFPLACEQFAQIAETIAAAIDKPAAKLTVALPPAEDRFIIERVQKDQVRFLFKNHLPEPLQASETPFEQSGEGRRCVLGDKDADGWRLVDQSPVFTSAGDDLYVQIDGMSVQDRRSVWAAASIRRNPTLHWRFVYRTAEIYLQEPVVPFLKEVETVLLGPRGPETLATRLAAALAPILATKKDTETGRVLSFPLQLRLGVEPRRLAERFKGHVLPEPTPKVQLVCTANAHDELVIGTRLAKLFLDEMAGESLGAPEDAWLVLSVLLLTEQRQPLLEVPRIAISIDKLVQA